MGTVLKIAASGFNDAARSRWIFLYSAVVFALTYGLFQLRGDPATVLLSLTNISLLLVPLISLLFSAFYLYSSEEFIRFLLAQPIRRNELYHGLYWGVTAPLIGSFLVGAAPPLLLFSGAEQLPAAILLLGLTAVLTSVFTGISFLIGMVVEDRTRGFALAVSLWLVLAVLYDGAVLIAALLFQDYPLETPMIALTLLNPVDLARVLMLLKLDVSVLMGYTGATFHSFFGSAGGAVVAAGVLFAWVASLYYRGVRAFIAKDF